MYDTAVPWAESAGAHVMLYEFGSWVQEFLDGSSNLERMLDSASDRGAVQVTVAGNLSGMQKHAHAVLAASQIRDLRLLVPYGEALNLAWVSILWQGDAADLSVELVAPQGQSAELAGDGSVAVLGDDRVRSLLDLSPRGTVRFDILIYRDSGAVTEGSWTLRLRSTASAWTNVNAYVADSAHDWSGGVIFLDQVDDMYTVTSPGTADSAITVGSYATRGRYGGVPGALSPFSGQGPRLDGERVVDVAAPGHYADVACASSGSIEGAGLGQYGWFGGTSAAAPQAAGAAALLLQQSPSLSPSQVAQAIRAGARQDPFTGVAPNHRWGWGKLDVGAAASVPRIPTPTPRARILLPIAIKTR
jgi:subtilisin family serine protease